MTAPPIVVLGVSRSGTTLLKEMLDRHSQLAIPPESYFIPQLWDRHRERPDPAAFLADVGRIARVRQWGVTPEDVRRRLPPEPTFADAIQAIYRSYADARGKRRFGDKTPAYMQRLPLLEHAFPGAQYVHLVRDGRDAALSFLAMRRRPRFNWARPRGLGSFAVQWAYELGLAKRFGAQTAVARYIELRYEDLVAEPEPRLREICAFLGLDYEAAMLEYHRTVDTELLPDHPRLAQPPTKDVRNWREQMRPRDVELFEAIAGDVLAEHGYERAFPRPRPAARARAAAERAALRARIATWDVSVAAVRRSPMWRLRQVYVRRTAPGTGP